MSIQPTSSNIPIAPLVDIPVRGETRNISTAPQSQGILAAKTPSNEGLPENGAAKQQPTTEQVKEAADKANTAIAALQNGMQFSVDKASGINIVKIVDTETNKTIRQIPSEEMISIAHRLEEIKGLLIQNKA